MSAPTQPGSSTTSPTVAEINNSVASELSTADSAATQAVQSSSNIYNARLAQQTRAAASITARFGAGSPQAAAAEAKVTASKATVARVTILNQQVSAATPQVSATGWALYGHVYNAQLQPVSAYTVFLVDAKNAYQSVYGFTYTDSTGYFLISFAGEPASSQSETGSSSPRRRRSQAEEAVPIPVRRTSNRNQLSRQLRPPPHSLSRSPTQTPSRCDLSKQPFNPPSAPQPIKTSSCPPERRQSRTRPAIREISFPPPEGTRDEG